MPKALFDKVAVACEARREFQQGTQSIEARVARPAGRYLRGRITMTELTAANGSVTTEAGPLAGERVRAVGEIITTYEKHWNLTRDQALDRIHEDDPRTIDRIRTALAESAHLL